jgi:hypothetical protein
MEERPSARADIAWSLIWMVFGAAVLYGAWTMDRLEKLNINPYTAPGLVPGILGIGLIALGGLLLLRSLRAQSVAASGGAAHPLLTPRLLLALTLCLIYGLVLVGRGLPFWLATFVFVSAAIVSFQWPERRARGEVAKGALLAVICGAATAAAVTIVFQEIFLVRLP